MSDETCLKRQLLHASVATYHADPRYGGTPPWIAGPVSVPPAPSGEIDLALVGRFAEGLVVAFRGTLPPLDLSPDLTRIVIPDITGLAVAEDWRNDVTALRADRPAGRRPALPGRIHRGFAGSLDRLWDGVTAAVDQLRGTDPVLRLYFTGHSKGGALANLAALSALQAWPGATVKVVTFGAARAGDGDFAAAYRAAGIDCQRYEVAGDLVPALPPDGAAVGTGHAVAAVHFPRPPLFSRLWARDDRWRLPEPVAAHLPYRGFGYDRHVYETGAGPEWF